MCEHKPVGFATIVKEFYVNMVGKKEKMCYVRGKWISFDREEINKKFNLNEQNDGSKFKNLQKDQELQKIVELLMDRKGEWNSTKKNPFDSIVRGSLTEEAKIWFYFLNSVLLPSKHLSTVQKEEAVFLYVILKGYKMNVGKIIEKSIMSYNHSNYKGLRAFITKLCILGRVEGIWEEEERCLKTSPLTLTSITKPPSNKGKEKIQ